MSGKLDQSLDEILKSTRSTTKRGRGGARRGAGRGARAAPVGGVHKPANKKPAKAAAAAPAAEAAKDDNRLMVSNLPRDLSHEELNTYFKTAVGAEPKKLIMAYNANGNFSGSVTIYFANADQTNKAATALNRVRIDRRQVRVEKFVNAASVAAAPTKSLADRITQAKKDQPKPVAAPKGSDTRGRGAKGRRGRGGRYQRDRKTMEELDAEMEDYFPPEQNKGADAMVTNGGAQAGVGDTAMADDEML